MEIFKWILNITELVFYSSVIIYIIRRWKD